MKLQIYTVDAFTSAPFSGNPAAVCLLEKEISEATMQKIAIEFNLSETAFVKCLQEGKSFHEVDTFGLRWFTPTHEVALCGHATLSTACVLFKAVKNPFTTLKFRTLSGTLTAKNNSMGITLDLPLNTPIQMEENFRSAQLRRLISISTCGKAVSDILISHTTKKLLIRLDDAVTMEELQKLQPPIKEMMATYTGDEVMGVILTIKGSNKNGCVDKQSKQYDFVSRYFAPWHGIDEDPVTGSAHTVLAGYWSERLEKNQLYACQCSKRGGELHIALNSASRIDVTGEAVIVMEGFINI